MVYTNELILTFYIIMTYHQLWFAV